MKTYTYHCLLRSNCLVIELIHTSMQLGTLTKLRKDVACKQLKDTVVAHCYMCLSMLVGYIMSLFITVAATNSYLNPNRGFQHTSEEKVAK